MPSAPPQPVPGKQYPKSPASHQLNVPSSSRTGASPMSYGPMAGISFTNGGGFSFDNRNGTPRSQKMSVMGSYGARFYGDGGMESPNNAFCTSVTMEPSSFAISSAAFHLPGSSLSSSFRRSYADAARGGRDINPHALSTSFASMSFQPMSFGTSYSKSHLTQLMSSRTDAELTQSYVCCGVTHEGLHALLEHVEDTHPNGDLPLPDESTFSPMAAGMDLTHGMDLDLEGVEASLPVEEGSSSRGSLSPNPTHAVPTYPIPSKPTTPTETGLQAISISDFLASPQDSDLAPSLATRTGSTASSPHDGSSLATPSTSAQPSPVFAVPKINPGRGMFAPARPSPQKLFERAFNEVVAAMQDESDHTDDEAITLPTAVAPNVLFSTGSSVPPSANTSPQKKDGELPAEVPKPSADPALPAPSLFSEHRPWRCPNPGCNKSYKQSNGLKYHQQKGQCDFATKQAIDTGLTAREAEERNRPFVCAVGAGCTKRYRQMNGLKYHYLNSGEHGQYGLRMIQNGTHPQPPSFPALPSKRPSLPANGSSTTPNRPAGNGTAPYTVPNQGVKANPATPRMGTWPTRPGAGAGAGVTPKTPTAGVAAQSTATPTPTKSLFQPVQRGRDAVLFAAPSSDDMDVLGRMD